MNTVFTICSANYLSEALCLRETLRQWNEVPFYIILADKSPIDREENGIIEVDQLGIDDSLLQSLVDKYNIIEFNTAMKPFAFTYLIEKFGSGKIVYCDPDIMVMSELKTIWECLDDFDFAVTPHLLSHNIDPRKYNLLIASINTGVFNLGFFALRVNEVTRSFLSWWRTHLENYGKNDIIHGQFYDQKVLNLLPVFFERVCILKHPGMNVAQWNFHERHLQKKDNRYLSNGQPLIFFHCSGIQISSFDSNLEANHLLKEESDGEVYREIIQWYNDINLNNRYHYFRSLRCFYDFPPDIHRSSKIKVNSYRLKKWVRKTFKL